MKKIITVSFLAICFALQSQTTLPDNVKVYLPSFLKSPNEKDNTEWNDLIMKDRYGKDTKTYWEVYSDKDGNQTYTSPSGGNFYKRLSFGQKLIIADIQNNYALVYKESEYNQTYPVVKGESMGWVSLDNLLLWDRCPMDKNQVFRKAVVLINLDANNRGEIAPNFLSNPFTGAKSGKAANKLEFYFIMKTANINGKLFYLLSKNWTISSSIGRENNLYGWLGEGNVNTWDNRLCFETTWDSKAVNNFKSSEILPMVLKSEEFAKQYKKEGVVTEDKAYWIGQKLSTQRTDPQLVRLPLIASESKLTAGIYRVASIGQIGGSNGPIIDADSKAKLQREYQDLLNKINHVNIIFVVDGTISMGKYFKPIANAIDKSMRKDVKNSYKFGAVVYRDYTDGDKQIEKMLLTDNYETVSNFLNTREAKQPNGGDKNYEEAMFSGLETALKTMVRKNESNFIFLIGDCGNHNPDPQGKNITTIIDNLIDYRVNMLAFQANNGNNKAYNAFTLQAKQMISKTIDGVTKLAGSYGSVDIKLNSRGLYKTYRVGGKQNELTPIVGAYTFCNPNERKEPQYLESLVEDMIKEYGKTVSDRINELQNFLADGSTSIGTIPAAVKEELKLRGWSNDEIESLIDKEVKIAGYTCDNPGNMNYEMFVPVLFISHEEYISLLTQLNKLRSNEFVNNRTAYYQALRSLALTFFGNINVENIEVETLMAQMYGVPAKFKPSTLGGIKIVDVLEPKRVSQDKLREYIDNFNSRLPRFEKIQNDKSYIFLSNGIKYYWIPIAELP
ncbi:MAG: VWA domain-containing protein [Paludibacter sp.]|nr:VWA domain-containing protein [Paludibacter sp.]